jgi:hypothetical protein
MERLQSTSNGSVVTGGRTIAQRPPQTLVSTKSKMAGRERSGDKGSGSRTLHARLSLGIVCCSNRQMGDHIQPRWWDPQRQRYYTISCDSMSHWLKTGEGSRLWYAEGSAHKTDHPPRATMLVRDRIDRVQLRHNVGLRQSRRCLGQ